MTVSLAETVTVTVTVLERLTGYGRHYDCGYSNYNSQRSRLLYVSSCSQLLVGMWHSAIVSRAGSLEHAIEI